MRNARSIVPRHRTEHLETFLARQRGVTSQSRKSGAEAENHHVEQCNSPDPHGGLDLTGDIAGLSEEVRSRCHSIEKLMPSHWDAREKLWAAVRECVGKPMELWATMADKSPGRTAVALDVSPSMNNTLNSSIMRNTVRQLATEYQASLLVPMDTAIQGRWVPSG